MTGGHLYVARVVGSLRGAGIPVEWVETTPFELKHKGPAWLKRLLWLPRRVLENIIVAWKFRNCAADVNVMDHFGSRLLLLHAAWQRWIRKRSIVIVTHHFDRYRSTDRSFGGKIRKWMERFTFLLATNIIASSAFTEKEILSLGIPRNKVVVIQPSFDRNDFEHVEPGGKRQKNALDLLFVGSCVRRKGVHVLLEALALEPRQQIRAHLIGETGKDPAYYDEMLRFIREQALEEHVVFHGRVSQNRLGQFYLEADIFVLPSLWEGFGIVLLEAMYFGLPVIASDVSAIPELVSHEQNGILVPADDPQALANAIRLLVENDELRERLGQEGQRMAASWPSWSDVSRQLLEVALSESTE